MTSPATPPTPTPDPASEIVAKGPSALDPLSGTAAWKFGKLWSFSEDEHEKLEEVSERIDSYLNLAEHRRPLCIAVFGPPGSGKSFGVKEIFWQLKDGGASLAWTELNLTQFNSAQELGRDLVAAVKAVKSAKDIVPFVFFDEFDAALNGASLGWLSWFLAPMQDGQFIVNGVPFELKKAVYVFAGGTAAKLAEFGARDRDAFRVAKGPDFVSRLQTHIDVRGPNDLTSRELRRGMALWFALKTAEERTGKKLELDDAVLGELVHAGRYRHGQRSVEAVITMMAEKAAAGARLGRNSLPEDFLLDMQVDRGPLDPEMIGGLIGLSGGGFPTGKTRDDRDDMWKKLTETVWRLGGTLAYGGNWNPDGLTQAIIDLSLPQRLRRGSADEPRVEVFATTEPSGPIRARRW